ncbi:hypothetical protein H0X48_03265 [Candidatus Dependentiae bacterium]|nr:hypothetical protein [Candidatus Dependentiae bacterium]
MNHFFKITLLSLALLLSSTQSSLALLQSSKITPTQENKSYEPSPAEKFRADSRKLWTQHMVWDHECLVSVNNREPAHTEAITKRLMKNQEDIGAALGHYYGKAAGDKITHLLKEHIKIGNEVAKATKAHNVSARTNFVKEWYGNGNIIASTLSELTGVSKATLKSHWDTHLKLADRDLDTQIKQQWTKNISTVDKALEMGLMLADILAQATITKFNNKF